MTDSPGLVVLQIVDGREDGAGDLVSAAEEPVGEGQHLASGVVAECCEHHGEASEEKRCPAFDGEGGRIPPGEVEGQGQCDAEREAEPGWCRGKAAGCGESATSARPARERRSR